MRIKDIIKILEEKYPRKNAEDWDNVGLLIGDANREIKKIQLSLDATERAIEHAIENNVDLIITHHPIIFKAIKNIDYSTILGRKIIKLIENKISVYTAHTNLDASKDGLNEYIVSNLGVKTSKIIDVNEYDEEVGIGRIFSLEKPTTIKEYIDYYKKEFKIEKVRIICEDENKVVKKIALVNGSGMSYWRKAKSLGADLFITGDVSYHDALDAKEAGFDVADVGHFESENCFVEIMLNDLKKCDLDIVVYHDGPVFKIY